MASTKATYHKWEIVIVDLNPVRGKEISKIRPCLIVSPEPMNRFVHMVIIVPFTSKPRNFPFRVASKHKGVNGELCFDQIRTVSKDRIVKKDGKLPEGYRSIINEMLQEVFSEI